MNQQYASVWIRFVASIVDGFLIGIIFIVPGVLLQFITQGNEEMFSFWAIILNIVSLVVNIGYYVVYQAKSGQTIGKRTMGIKVVTADGKTPSMMTFFLREVVGKFVSSLILGIGYLMAIWDKNKQALHDKIANTYVVKVGVSAQPVATPVAQPQSQPAPQTK